jgi:hypothetical protein
MTILEADVAPRRPVPALDLHARIRAASNRLLAVTDSSEVTAQDALGSLVGGLMNMLPAGGKAPSKHDLVELIERVADALGCPPVPVVSRPDRRRQVLAGRAGAGGRR